MSDFTRIDSAYSSVMNRVHVIVLYDLLASGDARWAA
jgi:hypothetical protein